PLENDMNKIIQQMGATNKKCMIVHSNPQKNSLKHAFSIAPPGSTILCYSGIYDWNEDDNRQIGARIDPKEMHYEQYDEKNPPLVSSKRLTIIGSRGYDARSFEKISNLVLEKKIDVLKIITKILPFNQNVLQNLLDAGKDNSNLKIVFSPFFQIS
ncbi:MAG: hypothetical protein ACOCUL_04835, partial [Bacteroidota bacterium]